MSFLSGQLLNELSQSLHLTYSLLSFFFAAPSSLRSPIIYVHGTVFLTFLITETSSDQFET